MVRDDDWLEGLYTRRHRAVAAYCARRVGDADAADATAQVFAVAWRRRDDVPDERGELPWLYGVARRVVSHQWRGARRARRLVERAGSQRVPTPPGPESIAETSAERRRVRDAVMQLGSTDREVLLLSAWEGLSHAEIATVIGCSRSAVDKRIARAKRRLADRYTSMAEDPRSAATRRPSRSLPSASNEEVRAHER